MQDSVGRIMPSVADPAASGWLMVIGAIIIVATAIWAAGGLAAAAWVWFTGWRERRDHFSPRPARPHPR